jgi:hypothetical protein
VPARPRSGAEQDAEGRRARRALGDFLEDAECRLSTGPPRVIASVVITVVIESVIGGLKSLTGQWIAVNPVPKGTKSGSQRYEVT